MRLSRWLDYASVAALIVLALVKVIVIWHPRPEMLTITTITGLFLGATSAMICATVADVRVERDALEAQIQVLRRSKEDLESFSLTADQNKGVPLTVIPDSDDAY